MAIYPFCICPQRFHHRIVEGRTDDTNRLALPVGPGAIGQQHDSQSTFEVDPQGSSRVAKMAGRVAAEESAQTRKAGRAYPIPEPANSPAADQYESVNNWTVSERK